MNVCGRGARGETAAGLLGMVTVDPRQRKPRAASKVSTVLPGNGATRVSADALSLFLKNGNC